VVPLVLAVVQELVESENLLLYLPLLLPSTTT
jgi:hypothetical protein